MKNQYTIGLDFGTLSARALIVRLCDGKEIGYTECKYPHGVMDRLDCGKKLGSHWALQHPDDYLYAMKSSVSELLKKFSIPPEQVIGIGIDFTACTAMPVKEDATPLCNIEKYKNEPHAYTKLWKHHAAQYCADLITEKAISSGQSFLESCGGKVSSEFYFPKLLQIANEAPEIFEEADLFIEAGDWIVWLLTGKLTRNAPMASYKAMWNKQDGYPSLEFLDSLKEGFGKKALNKTRGKILPVGALAGRLCKKGAMLTGLCEDTAVASCVIDAHSALAGAGIVQKNKMLMILGTSGCHLTLSDRYEKVDGIFGVSDGGMFEGFYGYEAGQAGFGDHFEWMIQNIIPQHLFELAEKKGVHILDLLSQMAQKQKPGQSGLIALDWWNGNRSILCDSDLSGLILGLSLNSKPEDIYRALVEALAFGTKTIIDNFEKNNIPIDELYACGGITKNSFIMQLFSDVIGKNIRTVCSSNAVASGSAAYGAAASGVMSIEKAAKLIGKLNDKVYSPNADNEEVYKELYTEYKRLHDYFSSENNVMKKLLKIKKRQQA